MTQPILRIASRGSPLALAQAHLARMALARAHGWDENDLDTICPIRTLRTTGDRIQDRPLAEAGGKGLFVKEIEDALLQNEADLAVHSMKDMPAVQPHGLVLAAVLRREDPYDLFLARDVGSFAELQPGSRLGTSSVRRRAQVLRLRPDLEIVPLRGNVGTRLKKLANGDVDATLLAGAGLRRLDLTPSRSEKLDSDLWLPALCQGAIGLEIRADDARLQAMLTQVDDSPSHVRISCERGFLAALDGSCRTPIAGLAMIVGSTLRFRGEVLSLDGKISWDATQEMTLSASVTMETLQAACALGEDAAGEVRNKAGTLLPKF